MPCLNVGNNMIICFANQYLFEGFRFEIERYSGCPIRINKNGDVSKNEMFGVKNKKFWDVFKRFSELTLEEKKTYEV